MSDRWKFVTECNGDEVTCKAIPDTEKMNAYIWHATEQLSRKIMENEETLLIQCMATPVLESLIRKCRIELNRRAKI